jgi:hypothetical protein
MRGLPSIVFVRNDFLGDEGFHPVTQHNQLGWKLEIDHSTVPYSSITSGKLDAAREQ